LIRAFLPLVLLTACGSTPVAPTPRAPEVAPGVLAEVEALTALDSAPIGAVDATQEGTLVIVFASWCRYCRDEIAVLDTLRRERPGLRIIGLNAYESFDELSDETTLRGWLAAHAPWLRVALGDRLLPRFGGVPKIPTLFLFDRQGKLAKDYRRARRAPPTLDELRRDLALLQ
jgi:thiol-disulfide isomerase/thioredoxin